MTMWYPWGKCCCEPPPCDCCPGVLCGETLLCDQCMDGDRCPNGQCPQLPNCDCPCRCCFDGYECPECGCPDEARCWDGSCPGEEMTGVRACDCHCPCREPWDDPTVCNPVCWDGSPPVQTAQGCACPPVPCQDCVGLTEPDRLYLTVPETEGNEDIGYCKCECGKYNYPEDGAACPQDTGCNTSNETAFFNGKCCRDAAGVYTLYGGIYTKVVRSAKTTDDCHHGSTVNVHYKNEPFVLCTASWFRETPRFVSNLAVFCQDGSCRVEECDCGQQPPCFPGCLANDEVNFWCMGNEVSAGIVSERPGHGDDPTQTYRWVAYVSGFGFGWSAPIPYTITQFGQQHQCYPQGVLIYWDPWLPPVPPPHQRPLCWCPNGCIGILNSTPPPFP